MDVTAFVLSQLPREGARVLEVGCGDGELARALDAGGHDVLAIDPHAPEGAIFRRATIEELDETGFDAVVASRSLHHVDDLDVVLAKLAGLAPVLVVDEFAWDRMDEATARWYEEQRRAGVDVPPVSGWRERYGHLHGFEALRAALARHFAERLFDWVPYVHRYAHRPELEQVERDLIAAGAIRALGFRFVGAPRD